MDKWNREMLDKYLRSFDAGLMAFVAPQPLTSTSSITPDKFKALPLIDIHGNQTGRLPIFTNTKVGLNEFSLNESSSMLRILKGGQSSLEEKPVGNWITFNVEKKNEAKMNYFPVVFAKDASNKNNKPEAIVLQDFGKRDGIQKVIFGIRRIPPNDSHRKRRKKVDLRKQSLHWIQHTLF